MATNPNDAAARKLIGKFARALLATTCLTVASGGAALASNCTYNEGNSLETTLPTIVSLTANPDPGTTSVCANAVYTSNDYWELTGLGLGNYTVTGNEFAQGEGGYDLFISTNSTFTALVGPGQALATPFGPAAIPLNGDLYFEVVPGNSPESSGGFTVRVTTTSTAGGGAPEPSTLATAGLGLAGALAIGRKRRKQ